MFKRRTLFVVGAGASQEAGFPIGTQLARTIGKKLKPQVDDYEQFSHLEDRELFQELRRYRHNQSLKEYVQAAHKIYNGISLANSIDDFLNIHSNDQALVELGKAAIVRAILEAERNSKLFVNPSNIYNKMDLSKLQDTWYVKFMRILGSSGNPSQVEAVFDSVAFVIFNYDRCVEHFLAHGIHALFGISMQEAANIVRKITIIHPYGKIGDLDKVPFGNGDSTSASYFNLAKQIKTYTERLEEGDELEKIRDEVRRAQCVVFLGFSYLDQNMALLRSNKRLQRKPIFGTALGMSDSDRDVVTDELVKNFDPSPSIEPPKFVELNNNITSSQLFDFYARSLGAA